MGVEPKIRKRAYRSEKRDAARDATREKIVRAAARLLRSGGWGKFSVEAVASAAGVTRLTVYNQFGDRRALLEAVFDAQAEKGGLHTIAEAMANSDPQAALARVAEIFTEFWRRAGPMRAVIAAAMADRELAAAIAARNERRRQLLRVLVQRLVARGEITAEGSESLVSTLFALTSFAFYAELGASRASARSAAIIVRDLCAAAVERLRAARS